MDIHNIESPEDAAKLLRTWREDTVRCSDDIVSIWEEILSDPQVDLGDERWMVLEQVAVAAMDVDRKDIVTYCLRQLRSHFDHKSFRLTRLEAMRAEMLEKWDLALDILEQILEEDSSNSQARKRIIAIHLAQGENIKAINALTKYLEDFMNDGEAWMELCELYILEQDYTKASFCCEELILQNPHNHLYYQKFADIKYTQGGLDNVVLAKTYYCQAVKINSGNMRALYGLLLTVTQLASSPKSKAEEKVKHNKTIDWATKKLVNNYKSKLDGNTDGTSDSSRNEIETLIELCDNKFISV